MQTFFSARDETSTASAPAHEPNNMSTDQHKTILMVEDSDDARHAAEILLTSLGYAVISASNGEEAMKALVTNPKIDLLFTDLLMPGGMDGLMLADKVREMIPNLPVVLTTGYMDEFANNSFTSLEILPKPYIRSELEDKINLALRRVQGLTQ